MKKNFILSLFIGTLSFASYGSDMIDSMVEFTVNQMKRDGEFSNLANVSGLSEQRLEKAFRQSLSTCLNQEPKDDDNFIEHCINEQLSQSLSVTTTQLDRWIAQLDQTLTPLEQLEREIAMLEDQIYLIESKDELTKAEEDHLAMLNNDRLKLLAQQVKLQVKEADQMMADIQKISSQSK
ncbi:MULTISPECIES: hypothetical protein [Photobacterium]|uniref:Uncharacterized protein n=1 Tax=Photobacterium ganghwense TaxID=320778 RepID=A0A0J1HIS7_9GAMM|nr:MULTISPECIES: hypothetical protein [Photobacterium]KLV11523.1 hypothetical protein ABT57_01960 [Photobacterium ganghwense]MBV1841526.1 hypothetical protein [Photobacterium ganghwense]PSU08389.1 hypothetical protein C9I92_12765 [Photobacterium ganghwense]QSV15197.1 hypothetical protein FH974_06315 [Photobacterium ganghwense]